MRNSQLSFSAVTQTIGYGVIAKRANVSYQTVSRFAQNPEPGYKFNVRRRILDAVILEAKKRQTTLHREITELDQQITDLEGWRTEFTH
jgi:hypothetical protein